MKRSTCILIAVAAVAGFLCARSMLFGEIEINRPAGQKTATQQTTTQKTTTQKAATQNTTTVAKDSLQGLRNEFIEAMKLRAATMTEVELKHAVEEARRPQREAEAVHRLLEIEKAIAGLADEMGDTKAGVLARDLHGFLDKQLTTSHLKPTGKT